MGEPPPDNVICLPAFLSAGTKANDKVYRDVEASSIVRMEKAAEAAGVDVSDMAAMKITDLNPTTRAGDIAAVPINNAVTQQMDMINARGGAVGWQGSNGVEFSAGVQSGPYPNVGAKMRSMIHAQNGAITNNPGLETLAPGYRIRG